MSHMSTLDYTKIGLAAYSPLEEGILTGKYNQETPADSRLEKIKGTAFEERFTKYFAKILSEENLIKLRKLEELAKEHEISMAQLSLSWLLSKDFLHTAIVGASKVEHIEESTQTSNLELDKEVFTKIEEIMDNEPEYQGHHLTWSYNRIKKILQNSNYRIPSTAQEIRESRKEKEKQE